jgi:8-oxo-dGTP diphosphatase/2-hydroxy-dATP diphosphatase
MKKLMTVGLIIEGDRVLLGMKKRGFGEGRWNGFGGKVHPNETNEEAMKRELFEETGLKALKLEDYGKIEFEFENDPVHLELHFFRINSYTGEAIETEEMKPQWFSINEIPYDKMWPVDRQWMELFVKQKKFGGKVLYKDKNTLLKAEIKETGAK